MQQNWTHPYAYAFPPLSTIGKALGKALRQGTYLLLIAPMWQTWYPLLMRMAITNPILLPVSNNLLKNPIGEQHPLIQQGNLHLSVWRITGSKMLEQKYQQQLLPLSLNQEDLALEIIMQVPVLNELG